MAYYFVDPTNGSNDNDGLTPDNAFADFFTGIGGVGDIPVFWIKRGEDISITETKTLNFGTINTWPKSTDGWFADRPQEGIDAGWDSDITTEATVSVDQADITSMEISLLDTSELKFNGITFDLGSVGGQLFSLRSAWIIFNYCQFIGDAFSVHLFAYKAGSSSKDLENGVVELNNCKVENKDWATTGSIFYYNYGNDDTNYKKELHLNDTVISGIETCVYSVRSQNYHGRYIKIFTENCDIAVSGTFARVSNRYGTQSQYQYYTINNTTIQAEASIFETATGTDYCSRHFVFHADGSEFWAGIYIINDYRSTSTTSYYSRMTEIILRNSIFTSQRFYSNYAYNKVYMDKLDIKDCTFKDMGIVFYFYGLNAVTAFDFTNNILSEVDVLIHCSDSYTNKCSFNISLKGQSITSYLINRCSGGEIYLEDCNIGKELSSSSTENLTIVAVNSNFDAIKGTGHMVSLNSCRIESGSGSALSDLNGEINDSQIISSHSEILGDNSSVSFNGCNLSVKEIAVPLRNNIKIIKSVINGIPTPLKILNNRITKEISPIYRVNGNPFSLLVNVLPQSFNTRSIVNEVYATHINAKPLLTLYLTSVEDITDTDVVSIKASFVSEGILKTVDMPVVLDTLSQWDGVQVENLKYKAVVNLSSFVIVDGSKIKMLMSLSHEAGKTASINIDTLVGQE
jgi:hypothetical protein